VTARYCQRRTPRGGISIRGLSWERSTRPRSTASGAVSGSERSCLLSRFERRTSRWGTWAMAIQRAMQDARKVQGTELVSVIR